MRFWTSWYSGYYANEGCTEPPIQTWVSGSRGRSDGKEELIFCAVIDDANETVIEDKLRHYFPDLQMRFCDETESDYIPGSRFPHFEDRTKL